MQTLNYWKQFSHTGKVEDYLSYVKQDRLQPKDEYRQSGENSYAGIHKCNRNDTKNCAYWGI